MQFLSENTFKINHSALGITAKQLLQQLVRLRLWETPVTKMVLLQTARAVALNEIGQISVQVGILFDTGGQRSYITIEL